MSIDRLDALLQRLSVAAQMFHSGPLCGVTNFYGTADAGHLHLLKKGMVEIDHGKRRVRVNRPSLIFYPRPLRHRFITNKQHGADMACASVVFNGGSLNPIAEALPATVIMPLHEVKGAAAVLDTLFDEAFSQQCGRHHIVNRLFEVVIILIVRTMLDRGLTDSGVLAGMANPRLAKALTAVHANPSQQWTLERLAECAGMSRSQFAASFHRCVGLTPADYVARYRIAMAQQLLMNGSALKLVASEVGYGSTAALSRAFKLLVGRSPREWTRREGEAHRS